MSNSRELFEFEADYFNTCKACLIIQLMFFSQIMKGNTYFQIIEITKSVELVLLKKPMEVLHRIK